MRALHGNRGFHLELSDDVPSSSLGRLARESGVGEGGLRATLRVQGGTKEAILALDELVGEGEGLSDLEPLVGPLAEQIEPLLLRLDDALAEPGAQAVIAGQGWYRLRREDLAALQRWLDARTFDQQDPLALLAQAALAHARAHDLPRLEISEQRPGLTLTPWDRVRAEATQLLEPRPSPTRRFVRGLLALFAGDAREAERELAAARMGAERRAERWVSIARNTALQQHQVEHHYRGPARKPSPELLARLALERPPEDPVARKSWRNRVLLGIALVGALLLWLLDRSLRANLDALQDTTEQLDEP